MAAPPAAGAALGVAGALLLLGSLRPPPPSPECPAPVELAQRGAHTRAVRCGGGAGPPLRGPARLLFGARLDPNRADAASLEVLPGVGPARAAAIVEARCRQSFEAPLDLARVPGIGPRTASRLAAWIEVRPGAPARCDLVP